MIKVKTLSRISPKMLDPDQLLKFITPVGPSKPLLKGFLSIAL